ncbi:MAG: hypothetical protein KatS3mg105_3327 [Gemmatales bacterium]|nr:MAG: hypothetical protein KatS3mg105_3327 [Gemmatales bacterium]
MKTRGIDLTGKTYGIVTVIERDRNHKLKTRQSCWRVRCGGCGKEWTVRGSDLANWKIVTCGKCRPKKLNIQPGMRFGQLTAKAPTRNGWLFDCDCGKSTAVRTGNIGVTKSCGCLRHERTVDMTGKRCGRWTVDRIAEKRIDGHVAWHVTCDCGRKAIKSGRDLRERTGARGCGKCSRGMDLTGQVFGHAKVLRMRPRQKGVKGAMFDCSCLLCGREFVARGGNLRNGSTTSCGCYKSKRMAAMNRSRNGKPAALQPNMATPTKKKGGWPRDHETAEVYEFCYAQYILAGKKASLVRAEAIEKFGQDRAPKAVATVNVFARRHAQYAGLPWNRKPSV